MNRGIYSSWEIQHGYNSDHFLKGEASRVGEYEIKKQPASSASSSSKLEQKLLSHSQWTLYKRKVCVHDSQAKSVVVTKTGHRLSLFSFEQTKEKI